MKSLGSIAAVVLFGLFAYSPAAQATQIIIDNSNFQTLPAGGLTYNCGSGCAYDVNAIPGWTTAGNGSIPSGQFQPGTQDGNDTSFNSIPDGGTTVAYTYGPSLSQVVDTSVQVGQVYTLTVEIGTRNDVASGGSADLLVNGVQYMANGTMAPDGQWATFTATYVGLAVDMGDSITIQLNDTDGATGAFDDVALTETGSSVPEPASICSAGMALFFMLIFCSPRKLCAKAR